MSKVHDMSNKHRKVVRTVQEAVEALGGTTATAAIVKVVPHAVSNWKRAQFIPPGHHLPLYLALQQREVEVDVKALFWVGAEHEPRRLAAAE